MDTHSAPQEHTFETLGISGEILRIIRSLNLSAPTPIQAQAIPHGVAGRDVIGIAQTGTGKTFAFGVPLLQRSMEDRNARALILVPTRELALQVHESLGKFAHPLSLRGAVLIGGAGMQPQVASLRRDPHVIIATPGRLIDHLEQRNVTLDRISVLVLDEADRMLDMGFWPQVQKIIRFVPAERQTMLFSATLSKEIMELATKHMKTPVSIEVAPQGTTAERVTQEFFIVRKDDKLRLLEKVLGQYSGSTLVFTRTKYGAKKIQHAIRAMGHKAAEIHGNRSLSQRRDALEGFKTGRYRVLVATDIASRGIDVKGIELVINYDLPMDSADYVHRIGRTARAGAEGHAISFAEPNQKRDIRDIERLIRMPLTLAESPELPPVAFHESASRPPQRGFRPRPQGSGGFGGSRPRNGSYRGGRSFGRPQGRSQSGGSRSGGSRRGSGRIPYRGTL